MGVTIASFVQPERTAVVDCDPHYEYSSLYCLAGFPRVCLHHGVDDPGGQPTKTGELARRGNPHEFHSYEGLSHYFSTDACNATV